MPINAKKLRRRRRQQNKKNWILATGGNNEIEFEGTLVCAAPEAEDGLPTFNLLANTGSPMRLKGFAHPVVIDLKGARFDRNPTPVIIDHDTKRRFGHTTMQEVQVAQNQIVASGVVSSTTEEALSIVADAGKGFPFQVSLGAPIIKGRFIKAGETVQVNGQSFKGPLIVASETRIRELTVTVLGADSSTNASIAAQTFTGENDMPPFEQWAADLGLDINAMDDTTALRAQYDRLQELEASSTTTTVTVPEGEGSETIEAGNDDDPVSQLRNLQADELERTSAIQAMAAQFQGEIDNLSINGNDVPFAQASAHAVREGWSAEQFELACRRAERPNQGVPAIHSRNQDIDGAALECSMLRHYGVPSNARNSVSEIDFGLEHMFNEQTLEASHDRRYQVGGSIQQLLDLQIRAAGMYYPGMDRNSGDFIGTAIEAWGKIQASGFSTLNVVNVLENTMHKASLSSFNSVESVWRFICGRKPLNDFRPHNMYRVDPDGHFKQVATDGELKHVSMTDTKYTIQADTYGAMLTIDRKTIRNDDLGMVVDQARALGLLGGQRIEESVMVLLLSNPSSFFSVGNNNLISGASSELNDVTEGNGLDLARQTFRGHIINGKPIGVSPSILLVGTTRETTANRLWTQERVSDNISGENFVNNPHVGLYRPYVSPYLNNTSITDQDGGSITGQSATQWYLFANPNSPQGAALCIGFMDGRETPFVDEAETQFNIPGGIQMRAYLDWGVAMNVTQMALKSAGA